MGIVDYGTQDITLQYNESAEAKKFNRAFTGLRRRGIYSGGYLSISDDTHVVLSQLLCEIGDNTYQVRISTAATVSLVVGISTPYVVLRWVYSASATNYMDVFAVGVAGIQDNDLIIGRCIFIGASLDGIDYAERTNPLIMDLFLLVEPTEVPSMKVRIRAGRVNYGSINYDISDQLTVDFSVPSADSRIDVVYVDDDGAVKVFTGVESATPTAPDYISKIVLAQVTLTNGMTEITAAEIKDVRKFCS